MPIHEAEVLDKTTVLLNAKEYRLLGGDLARQLEQESSARRWNVVNKRVAQTHNYPANVRPGPIEDQYVMTINDWSKGMAAGSDQRPGTLSGGTAVNGFIPGTLRVNARELQLGITNATMLDPTSEITILIIFNAQLFLISGRYVTNVTAGGTIAVDKDFGAGIRVTDAIVWNNELVVGFGGSTTKIWSRATGGTWTQATDAVYADHFALVIDRLWRATATNQVGNIASGDNPLTLANWSAGIAIGDNSIGITDLNVLGQRVLVSKPEGLFPGDASAQFNNVLPSTGPLTDPDNGKNTLVTGEVVFYPMPFVNDLIRWQDGVRPYNVGLEKYLEALQITGTSTALPESPSSKILAMAAQGQYLWAVTAPSTYPHSDPLGFMKTVNSGTSYTDYTAVVGNNLDTSAALGALDTLANGDWVVVGFATNDALGLDLELSAVNSNASVLTVEYWNGAWVAAPMATDLTVAPALNSPSTRGTATLSRSSQIYWDRATMSADWASSTLSGITAYWVRLSVSAALSAPVHVLECRILRAPFMAEELSGLFRGRAALSDDIVDSPIVWEPHGQVAGIWHPGAIAFGDPRTWPFHHAGAIIVAGLAEVTAHAISGDINTDGYIRASGPGFGTNFVAWSPSYDFGMPNTLKRLIRAQIKGRNIATDSVQVNFFADTAVPALGAAATTMVCDIDNEVGVVTAAGTGPDFSVADFYRLRLIYLFSPSTSDAHGILEALELTVMELGTFKKEYEMLLLVADGLTNSRGGVLPNAKVQLTNLEALLGTGGKTLIDPIGRSVVVSGFRVNVVEAYQFGSDTPGLAVSVRCVEE